MKNRIILILLFLAVSYNYGQNNSYYDIVDDIVLTDSIEYGQQATSVYTSKINLSGNYNMMVIVIGFPDVPSTRN